LIMTGIILRNPTHAVAHVPVDSWAWSWDPFRTLAALIAAEPSAASAAANDVVFAPRFDVKEDKGEYVLSADLPGVKPEAVEISLDGDRLKVSGRRENRHKEETEQTCLSEISYGSFARELTLPEGVDGEHVHASLKDGVLTLVLPKKPEARPRKIAVTS